MSAQRTASELFSSPPTRPRRLVAAARLANNKRRIVNNLFGEGMSPKMRSLRMGLDALGLAAGRVPAPPLAYGCSMPFRWSPTADDSCSGLTRTPKYVLPVSGWSDNHRSHRRPLGRALAEGSAGIVPRR